MASTKITRTSSASSEKKLTISYWLKRSTTGEESVIGNTNNGSNWSMFYFNGANKLQFASYIGGSYVMRYTTNRTFSDVGAWYHLVATVDVSLSSPEVKVYVNGEEQTSLEYNVTPSQNADIGWFNAWNFEIGVQFGSSYYLNGCLSDLYYIQGYIYPASTFGESDSTSGIWKPKTNPTINFGGNGGNSCHLKFDDSSNMDKDSGDNDISFTTTGTLTQTEDTPSNNFATLNAVYKAAYQPTFSTGNLTATAPNSGEYYPAFSSLGVETGKWYMEYKIGSAGTFHIGICSENDANTVFPTTDNYMGESSKSVGISDGNGSYYISGSATSYGSSYTSGDIIGLALDMTNKKLYVSKNGTFFNSANPASGTGGIDISGILSSGDIAFFAHSCYGGTGTRSIEANFGNGRFGTTALASSNSDSAGLGLFEYSVPSGYYALCTKNIKNYG